MFLKRFGKVRRPPSLAVPTPLPRATPSATAAARRLSLCFGFFRRFRCSASLLSPRPLLRLLLVAPAAFASAQEAGPAPAAETISMQDVHRVSLQLTADIEALRAFAGAQPVSDWAWSIGDAAPRHLFYMAQNLYTKTNELAREMTGIPAVAIPPVPRGEITQADAFALVNMAHNRLKGIATRLRAPIGTDQNVDLSSRPAVVMASMVMASRQLNAMLHREFRHPDIYQQIEKAVFRAGQLSGDYPPIPSLEAGRSTTDVYRQVIDCLDLVYQLATANNLPAMRLNFRRERRRRDVVVADVYGLSALLAADLAWLAPRLGAIDGDQSSTPYARPAPIFPSQTYRLTQVLATQLRSLTGP